MNLCTFCDVQPILVLLVNSIFLHAFDLICYLVFSIFRLKQRWIEVTVDTQVDELIKAVRHRFKSEVLDNAGGIYRTMVFANTVEAVEAVAKILLQSGVECLRYHKNCTLEERAQTLVDFHEKGGVLVCTDAAARGVDIPNVLHVIQVNLTLYLSIIGFRSNYSFYLVLAKSLLILGFQSKQN